MAQPSELRAVKVAQARVHRAGDELYDARRSLYEAMKAAQAAGVSLSTMARELGVSRQAIQKMASRT